MATTRNVRWYESRQDRASERADRLVRLMRKLVDQQIDLSNQAGKMNHPKKAKARKQLEDRAFALSQRVRRLSDQVTAARAESSRYGKAKTKVGIHDPVYGWKDKPARDASRSPRRRTAKKRQTSSRARRR